MTVCQKVPKSYFQSQFWMSKINQILWNFFLKKFDQFLTSKIDFESTILALFEKLSLLVGFFQRFFLGGMLILGQKACFKGPTIFEIPQPNWYYWSTIHSPQPNSEPENQCIILSIVGFIVLLSNLYIVHTELCRRESCCSLLVYSSLMNSGFILSVPSFLH